MGVWTKIWLPSCSKSRVRYQRINDDKLIAMLPGQRLTARFLGINRGSRFAKGLPSSTEHSIAAMR